MYVVMEAGTSSSSGLLLRFLKPGDMASTSRGNFVISSEGTASVSEEHFPRSDSVPNLEDLIAGDSRLEELFKGDSAVLLTKQCEQGEGGDDTDDEDEGEEVADHTGLIGPCCDRGHVLRFLTVPPYRTGAFDCNVCSQRGTGQVYHCETCLFDLCPRCAVRTASPVMESEWNPSSSLASSISALEIPPSWGQPLLGCCDRSHTLEILESAPYENGVYMCNLCLRTGEAEVYHCTLCTDFDLHPECARITREIMSFTHPHRLVLQPPYSRGRNAMCDGCLEILGGSQWTYRCSTSGCDFDLHARCAKYARTILHPIHEEHELVLINESTAGPNSHVMCDACDGAVDLKELVYHCEECGFDLHPTCAIGSDVVHS